MRLSLKSALVPLAILAALFSPTPASARIGWTLDECRTNWGAALSKDAPRNTESEDSYFFEKKVTDEKSGYVSTILIHAEFKAGKVWLVRYSGSIKTADRIKLLEVNKGESLWEESETYLNRSFWITKEKKDRLACEYRIGAKTVIEIMTSDCFKSLATQKAAVAKTVVGNPNYEPPLPGINAATGEAKPGEGTTTTPTPGAGSKLEGF